MRRIPSPGSQFVADSVLNFNIAKAHTSKIGLGGAALGLSSDPGTQQVATGIQILAAMLDGTIDFVQQHGDAIKDGTRVTAASMSAVSGIVKVALNVEQGGSDADRVLLAALAALAIDVGLTIACPPAGVGVIFCSLGLISTSLNVVAAGRGFKNANEAYFRLHGAEIRRKQWMNHICVIAPTKLFYMYKPPARAMCGGNVFATCPKRSVAASKAKPSQPRVSRAAVPSRRAR